VARSASLLDGRSGQGSARACCARLLERFEAGAEKGEDGVELPATSLVVHASSLEVFRSASRVKAPVSELATSCAEVFDDRWRDDVLQLREARSKVAAKRWIVVELLAEYAPLSQV
jgi:hypothetical protein